jgi:hypothetical protein
MRFTRNVLAGLLAVVLSSLPAFAEKRVALVIGNAAYTNAPKLKNPRHDAEDMTAALEKLSFKVVSGFDLDERGMAQKAREFSREVVGADVALFFYAGHGLQVNGLNYLAPVNTSLKNETDLDFETLPLELVLKQMRQARVSLVFLDACRDNPLTRSLKSATRSGAASTGLARIEDATGMMISFATQPGNVALDGDGRNSPYSKALLANIAKPGVSVGDAMIEVRKQVLAETSDKQVPWENSSLTGKFYFVPGGDGAAPAQQIAAVPQTMAKDVMTVPDSTVDHTFWTSVAASNNPDLYREYLRRFPNGSYAVIAQARIEAASKPRSTLQPPQQQVAGLPSLPPGSPQPLPPQPQLAALPPPALKPGPSAPPLSPKAMAEAQQKELKRVGCFAETIDGTWGADSMRAMATYNAQAKTALPIDSPSSEAISTLQAQTKTVCATEAAAPPAAKTPRKKATAQSDDDEKPKAKRKSSSASPRPSESSGGSQKQSQSSNSDSVGAAVVGGAIVGGVIGGVLARQRR